jgi:hypothetical protein
MSTRRIILLLIWILPFSAFTQTIDTTYCLDIRKARLLVSDAYTKRYQDSLISQLSGKITLLGAEKASNWNSFNSIITIEQEKTRAEILLSGNYKKLSEAGNQETEYYKRRERKARRQRNLAVILGLLLVGLAVTN